MEYFKLNNGCSIPLLGLGTWQSQPGEVACALKEAIKIGYRHIDCAHFYLNEAEIGEALKDCFSSGLCKREDLFITSKLWNNCHAPEAVAPALELTLKNLQLDYLDMYLMHWPVALRTDFPSKPEDLISLEEIPLESTWAAMEECVKAGKTKGIGVSNFSIKKLEHLLSKCTIPPAVNQVERHPYLAQFKLLEYCNSKGIHITGYSGLGSPLRPQIMKEENEPTLLEDPVITEIAKECSATPAQVLLKWAMVTGASTIPKSVKAHRLLENYNSIHVTLPEESISKINALDSNRRYITGSFFAIPGSPYTLENIWDE